MNEHSDSKLLAAVAFVDMIKWRKKGVCVAKLIRWRKREKAVEKCTVE